MACVLCSLWIYHAHRYWRSEILLPRVHVDAPSEWKDVDSFQRPHTTQDDLDGRNHRMRIHISASSDTDISWLEQTDDSAIFRLISTIVQSI